MKEPTMRAISLVAFVAFMVPFCLCLSKKEAINEESDTYSIVYYEDSAEDTEDKCVVETKEKTLNPHYGYWYDDTIFTMDEQSVLKSIAKQTNTDENWLMAMATYVYCHQNDSRFTPTQKMMDALVYSLGEWKSYYGYSAELGFYGQIYSHVPADGVNCSVKELIMIHCSTNYYYLQMTYAERGAVALLAEEFRSNQDLVEYIVVE